MTQHRPDEPPRTDSFRPSARTTLSIIAAFVVTFVVVTLVVTLGPRVVDRLFGDREVAADAPLDEQCRSVPDSARRVTLPGLLDGRPLGGAVVGADDARTAVVLRHGASQTLCDWLDWADELVDATGVRVVLFDRRGQGSSPGEAGLALEPLETAIVAAWSRETGADEVVLVASSMGNSVTFAALEAIDDAVCALVSISPVLTSADASGQVDGRSPTALPPAVDSCT